jgi:hypothetical protein
MQTDLTVKLKAMLWDIPETNRLEIANEIIANPVEAFRKDDQLFMKALNSLQWYELIKLVKTQDLYLLLTEATIKKLFPAQRRLYYTNVKRLLSKYTLSTSG